MTVMKNKEKNGANRCPHCGATDVTLVAKTGKLKCKFCRSEFDGVAANARGGVENLKGDVIGEGAVNIVPDEKIIVTLKCPACGAEVVINTDEATSARCHWCRHVLSINEKMPNGAVPDLVLPFKTEKTIAEGNIREFVKKRQFFAHPKFKKEFAPDNVMGVYLPYMIVDVNAHASMKGEAEHLIRRYTSGSGNHKRTYYDAEAFSVTREFDLLVDDLTIESSKERLKQDVRENTNNIINAIMPFDTENAVAWNPNYLHGYASERRDTNIDDLRDQLKLQVGDIARYKVKESMAYYDRGAKWTSEEVETKGAKWKAAYLPVWLYSYLETKGDKKMLHYVAVNARTGETMGSVPINKTRLMFVSAILELIGLIMGFWWIRFWLGIDTDDDNPFWLGAAGLTPGFIFYWIKAAKYRNMNARHKHEAETPSEIKNLKKTDTSIGRRNRLSSASIAGRNDSIVKGVVAKAGARMMGEKMANYIGIGRMVGSTPSQTPVGQATEAQIQTNKSVAKAIKTVLIIIVLMPLFSFVVLFFVMIVFGGHESVKRKSSSTSSSASVNSSFVSFSDDMKNLADKNSYLYSHFVTDMVFYDKNSDTDYTRVSLNSSNYVKAFSITKLEIADNKLSSFRMASDAGEELDETVEKAGFGSAQYSKMLRDSDGKDLVMRLYARENKSDNTYDFCDLRETEMSRTSLGGSYRVMLNCVEITDDVFEKGKLRI